jgi:hypothetical protein
LLVSVLLLLSLLRLLLLLLVLVLVLLLLLRRPPHTYIFPCPLPGVRGQQHCCMTLQLLLLLLLQNHVAVRHPHVLSFVHSLA